MRRFSFLLLAVMTALTVGLAANHKTVRPMYMLLTPEGDWAVGAYAELAWTWDDHSGVSSHFSNRHGMVLFEVPIEVTTATLTADVDDYCLPPTTVSVSRAHPGKYAEYTMIPCGN